MVLTKHCQETCYTALMALTTPGLIYDYPFQTLQTARWMAHLQMEAFDWRRIQLRQLWDQSIIVTAYVSGESGLAQNHSPKLNSSNIPKLSFLFSSCHLACLHESNIPYQYDLRFTPF